MPKRGVKRTAESENKRLTRKNTSVEIKSRNKRENKNNNSKIEFKNVSNNLKKFYGSQKKKNNKIFVNCENEIIWEDKLCQNELFKYSDLNNKSGDDIKLFDNVELKELLYSTCRLCFKKGDVLDIFKTNYDNNKLVQIIYTVTTELIPETDPRVICTQCLPFLLQAYNFYKTFKQSSLILNQVLAKIEEVPEKSLNNDFKESAINKESFEIDRNESNEESNDSKMELSKINKLDLINEDKSTESDFTTNKLKGIFQCKLCTQKISFKSSTGKIEKHYLQKHALKVTDLLTKAFCMICKFDFKSENVVEHFESKEHLNNSKTCPICFKIVPTILILSKHVKIHGIQTGYIRKFHNDFPCILCKLKFDTYRELNAHFDANHWNNKKCIICAKLCKQRIKLHMTSHLANRMELFCYDCFICFDYKEQLIEHKTSKEHLNNLQNSLNCKICKTRCKNRKALLNHMSLHKEERVICDICGHISASHYQFKQHAATHSDQLFYCDKCPKAFKEITTLNHHRRRHDLICSICQSVCTYEWQLKLHLAQHEVPSSVICSVQKCWQVFPDQDNLNAHLEANHERFTCNTCKEDFYNIEYFKGHTLIHNWESLPEPEDPRTCKLCKQSFSVDRTFYSHVYNMHKIFFCKICKKLFYSNIMLKEHEAKDHQIKTKRNLTGVTRQRQCRKGMEPRRTCDICLKQLASPESLYIHRKLHSGVKAFACMYCGKTFARKFTKILHERTHTGDKRYPCSVCGRRFLQQGDRNKHEQRHFKTEGFKQEIKGIGQEISSEPEDKVAATISQSNFDIGS